MADLESWFLILFPKHCMVIFKRYWHPVFVYYLSGDTVNWAGKTQINPPQNSNSLSSSSDALITNCFFSHHQKLVVNRYQADLLTTKNTTCVECPRDIETGLIRYFSILSLDGLAWTAVSQELAKHIYIHTSMSQKGAQEQPERTPGTF